MSPQPAPSSGASKDLYSWLETAISSANAELPSTPRAPRTPEASHSPTSSHTSSSSPIVLTPTSSSLADLETKAENSVEQHLGGYQRKLVTVRRIADVKPINKGHSVVTIDGWKVVVPKTDKFAKDDLVLFFEVDSFLPAASKYEDLFAQVGPLVTFDDEEGYRVGTSTWTDWDKNKIISQGHVCHLSKFPDIDEKIRKLHWEHIELNDDQFVELIRPIDFTAELGVKKWVSFPEKGEDINGVPTTNPKTPPFIPKTDMERVQNCPNLFTKPKYRYMTYQESLKLDGAGMTVYFVTPDSPFYSMLPALPAPSPANAHTMLQHAVHPTGRLGVCTRNQDLLPHLLPSRTAPALHTTCWTAAVAANLHRSLPALGQNIAIQAELVGPSIQGNPYGYAADAAHELFVFAVVDLAAGRRWHPRRAHAFAAGLGLKHVPVLGYHTIPALARHHQDLIDRAELKRGEGLVFKNCDDGRWFKVLSSRWILQKGDEKHARAKAKKAGKGKGVLVDEDEAEAEDGVVGERAEEAKRESFKGWQMSSEEAAKIREIFENLAEWMRRDDGLRKWMEEWEQGFHGKAMVVKPRGAATEGETAAPEGKKPKTSGGSASGQGAKPFAVPEEKRKELTDWLGIN